MGKFEVEYESGLKFFGEDQCGVSSSWTPEKSISADQPDEGQGKNFHLELRSEPRSYLLNLKNEEVILLLSGDRKINRGVRTAEMLEIQLDTWAI